MKIGIVTYGLLMGGAERFIFNLAKYLQDKKNQVDVIESSESGKWKIYFEENDIPVISQPFHMFSIPILHSYMLLRKMKHYDVIFFIDSPFAQVSVGKLNENIICIPVIQADCESFYYNATLSFGQCNSFVAVSNKVKDSLIEYNPIINKNLIQIIPNSIYIPAFKDKKYDFKNIIQVVFIGRIENSQKGVLLLPDIIEQLKKEGFPVRLSIIGEGPDEDRLKDKIQRLKLQNEIKIVGYLSYETVMKVIPEYDFLIMPSNLEGLPFVLLEAMVNGVIPIVSLLPGITDMLIKNEENGFFGYPGDTLSFVSAIKKAIDKIDSLSEISKNAYDIIKINYHVKKMGDNYLELINQNQLSKIKRNNKIDIKGISHYYKYFFLPIILNKILCKIGRILSVKK